MSFLRPFLLLVGRGATLWLGLIVLACVSILLAGLSNPEQPPYQWVDTNLLAAVVFPAAWGLLAGLLIQELQHMSFAWPLPGVRWKLLAALLATGLPVILLTSTLVALQATSVPFVALLALGLAGLGLGCVAIDPRSGWATLLTLSLLTGFAARSRYLADIVSEHPAATTAICLLLATVTFQRLFGTTTFRRKPFIPTAPLPGMYSFDRMLTHERGKLARRPPADSSWKHGYLGKDLWKWVAAAFHESTGSLGWRTVTKVASGTWPLWLLLVAHAWTEKGGMGFPRAFALTLYQEIMEPPGVPHLGEDSHEMLVTLFLAAAGAAFTFWTPVALRSSLLYPLSRRALGRVTARGRWLHSTLFLVVAGCFFLLVGQVAGTFAGYPVRMDYVPFFVWPLLATVALMPLAEWGALRALGGSARRSEGEFAVYIGGLVAFVAMVAAWTFLAPRLLGGPTLTLIVTICLLLASHLAFGRRMERYFATADLA